MHKFCCIFTIQFPVIDFRLVPLLLDPSVIYCNRMFMGAVRHYFGAQFDHRYQLSHSKHCVAKLLLR